MGVSPYRLWRHKQVIWRRGPIGSGLHSAVLSSLSQPEPLVSKEVLFCQLTEEEKTWGWFPHGFSQYASTTQKWTSIEGEPLSGESLRTVVEENPSNEKNLRGAHLVAHCTWRNSQTCNNIPNQGLWPDSLAGWAGTWKERDWKIGDKGVWGKRYMDRSLWKGKKMRCCVPHECLPKYHLSRGGF